MTVRTRAAAAAAAAALVLSFATTADADRAHRSTAVLDWDAVASRAAVAACLTPDGNPFHESRMYTMTLLAVSDALGAIDRRYRPYGPAFRAPRGASLDAAVATAAHDVLVATLEDLPLVTPECVDAGTQVVRDAYEAALGRVPDGRAEDAGVDTGRRAAAGVLAARADDGSDQEMVDPDFPQGDGPGEYRFTPGTPFAFAPRWSEVEPFGLRDARQLAVDAPLPLTSRRYAREVAEVRRLGGDGVSEPTDRTPRQTEIALFWVGSSPLQWGALAHDLAARPGTDPWEQARLLALTHAAIADGYVATIAAKYDVLFWRPVTAIRLADTDGNPATSPNLDWNPLVATPPVPDHPSGHALVGAAAAAALRSALGTDRVRFSLCSSTLPSGTCGEPDEVRHHFVRLSDAAAENARSRVLVGFHFRYATEVGLDQGTDVGRYVSRHLLEPVD